KEYDYNSYLLKELTEANLLDGELELLEEEFETLSNVEEIKASLLHASQVMNEEEIGVLFLLNQLQVNFKKIGSFAHKYQSIAERIESSFIELDDVFSEVEKFQEQLDADPERLEKVNAKLLLLNNLFKKHLTTSVSELIEIKESLSIKVSETENLDENIQKKEKELKEIGRASCRERAQKRGRDGRRRKRR